MNLIERQAAIDEIDEWIKAFLEQGHKESAADARLIQDGIIQLPSAQPEKGYAKADYIMALHKEYGCDLDTAEKAHDMALEYLRSVSKMKG